LKFFLNHTAQSTENYLEGLFSINYPAKAGNTTANPKLLKFKV